MNRSELPDESITELIETLRKRFEQNTHRHERIEWSDVAARLSRSTNSLRALHQMERSGGEPDVVDFDAAADHFVFVDCSPESPKERRSICYDREALESRKEHRPRHNAVDLAAEMGIDLLTEEEYRLLQQFGPFDTKTSSWLETPADIRNLGGALFGDFRYGRTFIYHNGAQSYYSVRGFRGKVGV